jgi:cytochrome c556
MRFLAALAVALVVLVGVGAATADPGPAHERPAMAQEMVSDDHIRQHATMTEQMRTMSHTGHMSGPMWTDMRTTAHIQAEERYHAGIDRMLAR